MDLKDIQNLIKFVAKSGASEVKLETEDVKITIKTGSDDKQETTTYVQQIPVGAPVAQPAAPAPAPAAQPAAAETTTATTTAEDSKYITIKSPIIGTLYRKPSPDKPVFVEVGQTIKEGDVLCIIEAMKLFNEIESEVSGKIVKVLVDDSSPVEFDQPLFLVDPS
ncbi:MULTISPECIES: acetyl-CoA carboxylase biotin carboxyl carrier protein [Xanthomarina]|jgi:acetyl-CoA carboxylase biotin carboxyl carrier protein|uniref:Biotin carboxyl carrier protein of acetyl-CoA carboxylase n=2 Tax=Xanthomarina gelatinilytica TaxID=1137281 RepID=M7MLX0_9FLAO|nr:MULTISPECIES: acetyl-CoA carboxylase biotin carboxyl carrier protein [Xanthomarina]MCB0387765.1 acetyl-CoA carboxylase biotin carboxyl carrier protein [Winogradskyella sp.]EMQ95890.1 Biotin carboxyl carrier protein of acetyl-CoA carboxylase [Xanthomarina gelatinilytica]MAL22428.1 acetyl-CoA carboxylase, biotin carboxyl carrier protein [Xanthomarina sp.]MBF60901.1 acetyl-CoA carboxylase, biotin carboxyl carrier protein [Xanthomarina sp.]MDX1316028.1 acetyl-CoA carboxylase biotin carboxyl car|tara:strand:- start:1732 stop:2226 length:495 start_codon:yes stop_codon:yes gene_type:complete